LVSASVRAHIEHSLWRRAEQGRQNPRRSRAQPFLTVSMTHSAWRRNRGKKPLPELTVRIPASGSSCHFQPHTPTERRARGRESNTCTEQEGRQRGRQKAGLCAEWLLPRRMAEDLQPPFLPVWSLFSLIMPYSALKAAFSTIFLLAFA